MGKRSVAIPSLEGLALADQYPMSGVQGQRWESRICGPRGSACRLLLLQQQLNQRMRHLALGADGVVVLLHPFAGTDQPHLAALAQSVLRGHGARKYAESGPAKGLQQRVVLELAHHMWAQAVLRQPLVDMAAHDGMR